MAQVSHTDWFVVDGAGFAIGGAYATREAAWAAARELSEELECGLDVECVEHEAPTALPVEREDFAEHAAEAPKHA